MATLTLTPTRFGNSFSGRDTYSANALSMADSLPQVDFGFNDLRERMAQFTVRFDDFIERGRKRVLEERNAFRMSVAEMEETRRARKAAIVGLESKSSSHAETLAKEAAETDEMEEAIRVLVEQKDDHVARRDQLKAEVANTQAAIKQKRDAQAMHQRALEAQSRHNIPELRFWEQCLAMRIDPSGFGVQDQLRFVFSSTEERKDKREAWFELNMGVMDYVVADTQPKLEAEEVERVVARLNESRELGPFLKNMRSLLLGAIS